MPMAGRGSRFFGSNYQDPKPLIQVEGKPMFAWALSSIAKLDYSKICITGLKEHEERYNLPHLISEYADNFELKLLDNVPQGQLLSVLAHKDALDTSEDLLIISSDTYVQSNIHSDIDNLSGNTDGLISVGNMAGDSWSFAKTDNLGHVVRVAEKKRISDNASTGLYYFASSKEFVKYSELLIKKKKSVNGEYYVMPVYQEYLDDKRKIGLSHADIVWDLGNPSSLETFLNREQ